MSVYEGYMKEQCIDENGLYNWIKKSYCLFVDQGVLEITTLSSPSPNIATISLFGAKRAKEWSFTSALGGYAFDIIWLSGKIWSFLVEDEITCKEWVACFNQAIKNSNPNPSYAKQSQDLPSEPEIIKTKPIPEKFSSAIESHRRFLTQSQEFSPEYPQQIPQIISQEIPSEAQVSSESKFDSLSQGLMNINSIKANIDAALPPTFPKQNRNRYDVDNNIHNSQFPDAITPTKKDMNVSSNISAIPVSNNSVGMMTDSSPSDLSSTPPMASDPLKEPFVDLTSIPLHPPQPSREINTPRQLNNNNNVTLISSSDYLKNMKDLFHSTKKTLVDTEKELNNLRESNPTNELLSWQVK